MKWIKLVSRELKKIQLFFVPLNKGHPNVGPRCRAGTVFIYTLDQHFIDCCKNVGSVIKLANWDWHLCCTNAKNLKLKFIGIL